MKISDQTQKYETYDEQFFDPYNIGICIWYAFMSHRYHLVLCFPNTNYVQKIYQNLKQSFRL